MFEVTTAMRGTATIAACEPGNVGDASRTLSAMTLCHFTTAHVQVKSRSLHRICLPLSQHGVRVRYISPITSALPTGIDSISIPHRRSRFARSLRNWPLLRELLQTDAQLYHFQDPELLPLALGLKLLFKKRVIYDAYEDFPSMARASKSIPQLFRAISGKLVELAEQLAALCLDGVIAADPFTLRRFAQTGRSRKLVFSNFPNLEFFPPPSRAQKPFDLVYRGGLSERTGTYDLLNAVQLLKTRSRSLRLLLIGYFDSASAETAVRGRVQELGLTESVEIRGRIDHEEMARALSQARIGVCPLQATPKFALNVPVKVFEYWACGLPVIASDLRPIRPYFRTTRAGLLFAPGNSPELASSIEWILDHPNAAAAMGQNGRAAVVKRFNNSLEIRKLERFMAEIASSWDRESEDRP